MRALAWTMRDALLRVSEAAALEWRDLDLFTEREDGSARVYVARSKTDQWGMGDVLYLSRGARQALVEYGDEAADYGLVAAEKRVWPFSSGRLRGLIRGLADDAGLAGVSSHSFRVGLAHDLAAAGASLIQLQQAGRWRSPAMPARYARSETAGRSAVARYYAEDPPTP